LLIALSFNPLPHRIALAVRLDSSDHGRGRNIDLAGSLDDSLKCGTHISLSFDHQPEYVRVAIHSVAPDKVLLGYLCRTDPSHERLLDLIPFRVRADTALVLVSATAHGILADLGGLFLRAHTLLTSAWV